MAIDDTGNHVADLGLAVGLVADETHGYWGSALESQITICWLHCIYSARKIKKLTNKRSGQCVLCGVVLCPPLNHVSTNCKFDKRDETYRTCRRAGWCCERSIWHKG